MKDNTPTIAELRQKGYSVRVWHRGKDSSDREVLDSSVYLDRIANDGREVTEITITTPDGVSVAGLAYRAKEDPFNRKLGNRIALGRAWKHLQDLQQSFK